jgi:type VI secretion system secreted protein Hcp
MAVIGFGSPNQEQMVGGHIGEASLQAMYLQISGCPGSSVDSEHKGWSDIESCSFGVNQSTSANTGPGSGVGKANFHHLEVVKPIDKASPNLMQYCASGKHLDKVTLSVCKVGGGQKQYCKVELTGCFIVGVSLLSSTGSPYVKEKVAISYKKINFVYKDQDSSGSMGAAVTAAWDVEKNLAA